MASPWHPYGPGEVVETFVKLLAPFAPHLAEELWSKLGHEGTLAYTSWPSFDPAMTQHDTQEYVVQVNGKVRHRFEGAAGLDATALLTAAKTDSAVIALLDGRTVVKEIAIPGRLVNFVVESSRMAWGRFEWIEATRLCERERPVQRPEI
jgi:leucyl-tRNA synthetase